MERQSYSSRFSSYRASWKSDFMLPRSWYTPREQKKPGLRALLWSPELQFSPRFGEKSQENIHRLRELLRQLCGHNLKAYRLEDLSVAVSKREAMSQIEELKWLGRGDCCFIYYEGIGSLALDKLEVAESIPEPVFADSDSHELSLTSVWSGLDNIAEGVHVFIVLNFHYFYSIDTRGFYEPRPGSIAMLENALRSLPLDLDASLSPDGFFFEEFIDIIEANGAKMRYSNLLRQLELRYYQADRERKPRLRTFSDEVENTYIFSGVAAGKSEYRVYFNEKRQQWELNAGSANGIRPSLSFMHTHFVLDDGQEISVKDVFESYSTLIEFEEANFENTFDARLLQNALPKLKIGYHPGLDAGMRSSFVREVGRSDIYFIELVNEISEATFLIRNRDYEYYLVRNRDFMGEPDNRPVFFYQEDCFEFIKQLEYIAQWQALLELENPGNEMKNDVEVVFETIEGASSGLPSFESFKANTYTDPGSLDLFYRNGSPPHFRWRVLPKDGSGGEYHENSIYLTSAFGIIEVLNYDTRQKNPDDRGENSLSASMDGRMIGRIVDDFYVENGIREVQDYLLIVVSAEKMNIGPLLQPELEIEKATTRSLGYLRKEMKSFVLPGRDYLLKKIPIRIRYDERSFQQTIADLVKGRPIKVQADLHKNRWGGKPVSNGFELSAVVERVGGAESMKTEFVSDTRLWNVTLTVKNLTEGSVDGADVAFLLHDTFRDPQRFEVFEDRKAEISVIAYEDFTAAAILYDGTELELDLSYLPGLPDGFYAKIGSLAFEDQVATLLSRKEIVYPEDLQKGRWGGSPEAGGKRISAEVVPDGSTHLVTLTVVSTGNAGGEVAFLLHDSFDEKIAYRKLNPDRAAYSLHSYEAFTVGVYFSDGTELELDLNDRKLGFPDSFYYSEPV